MATDNVHEYQGYLGEKAIAYELLGILQSYAPTGLEQVQCSTVFNQLQNDGLLWGEIVTNLLGALHDGKAYGNWPWTKTRSAWEG